MITDHNSFTVVGKLKETGLFKRIVPLQTTVEAYFRSSVMVREGIFSFTKHHVNIHQRMTPDSVSISLLVSLPSNGYYRMVTQHRYTDTHFVCFGYRYNVRLENVLGNEEASPGALKAAILAPFVSAFDRFEEYRVR